VKSINSLEILLQRDHFFLRKLKCELLLLNKFLSQKVIQINLLEFKTSNQHINLLEN